MIDADPVVFRPCARLIIPERVGTIGIAAGAEGFGEAESEQFLKFGAGFGQEKRIIQPCGRIFRVARCGDNVVIAGENQGLFQSEERTGAGDQAIKPCELVGVFFGAERVAIWQIERNNSNHAVRERYQGLDIAGLFIKIVARQAARDVLQAVFREDSNAVEGFLAEDGNIVAEGFDLERRKCVFRAFEFLQADNIRIGFFQPGDEMLRALANRVDVP